jgi:hypothetical protein
MQLYVPSPHSYILYAPRRRGRRRRGAGAARRGRDEREDLRWEMELRDQLGVDNIWCAPHMRNRATKVEKTSKTGADCMPPSKLFPQRLALRSVV